MPRSTRRGRPPLDPTDRSVSLTVVLPSKACSTKSASARATRGARSPRWCVGSWRARRASARSRPNLWLDPVAEQPTAVATPGPAGPDRRGRGGHPPSAADPGCARGGRRPRIPLAGFRMHSRRRRTKGQVGVCPSAEKVLGRPQCLQIGAGGPGIMAFARFRRPRGRWGSLARRQSINPCPS